jgi:hypothetical protein
MILNLQRDIGSTEIQVISGLLLAVTHHGQHILHDLLKLAHISNVNVVGQSIEHFRVECLVCVEGQERSHETAIDVNFGIGDHNHFKSAEYDQQDVEQRTL